MLEDIYGLDLVPGGRPDDVSVCRGTVLTVGETIHRTIGCSYILGEDVAAENVLTAV